MNINDLKIVEEKAAGTWFEYGEGAAFLIASNERTAYQRAVTKATRKYPPHKVKNDPAIQTEIAVAAAAEALLLDFKGLDEDGKAMKNTLENRIKILKVPTLRNWIADKATDLSNFQSEGEASDIAELKS